MAQVCNSGALVIETEDVADLLVTFESGAVANIHLDYLGRKPRRGCMVLGDKGALTWDINDHWAHEPLDPVKYPGGWALREFDRDEMYRNELAHFLNVIEGRESPVCTISDGLMTLKVVEGAKESAQSGRMVVLGAPPL